MHEGKKLSLAESNRAKTTLKVEEALTYMKKRKIPINIKSVSEQAEITRKTLYNRLDLKLMVEEVISIQNDLNTSNTTEKRPKGSVQSERINKLREKNKQLIEDKKAILEQNMKLTKEINTLKQRLHDLEEMIHHQRNINIVQIGNKND